MKQLALGIVLLFGIHLASGQELLRSSLGAAGASEVIIEGETEYVIQQSVGQQSVIGSFSSENYTVRQGFIQPPIRIKSSFVDENDLDAVVYPNPFESSITIRFNEEVDGEVVIIIYDMLGRTVHEKVLQAFPELQVDLDFLSSAEYVLLLSAGNKNFKANLLKN